MLFRSFRLRTFCVVVALFLAAVWPGKIPAQGQSERAPAGVANYHRIDATFACSGAVPTEIIPELKRTGFASIINFRLADERGAEVEESKAVAAKVGLKYVHLPFRTPTAAVADAFLKAVSDPSNHPAFIHCGGGNRAAGMWLIKRLKIDRWDEERAVKEAEALGMQSPELKEFALSYAKGSR